MTDFGMARNLHHYDIYSRKSWVSKKVINQSINQSVSQSVNQSMDRNLHQDDIYSMKSRAS